MHFLKRPQTLEYAVSVRLPAIGEWSDLRQVIQAASGKGAFTMSLKTVEEILLAMDGEHLQLTGK